MKTMNAILIKTTDIVEYKNFYFAEVWKVVYNNQLFGYYYIDSSNGKNWYVLFYNMKLEQNINLPENCHFGEDCIYCHDINEVNILCSLISKMSFSKKFPSINN